MMNNLPTRILVHLDGKVHQIDDVGVPSANVLFYEHLFLKIEEPNVEFQREHQMHQWL